MVEKWSNGRIKKNKEVKETKVKKEPSWSNIWPEKPGFYFYLWEERVLVAKVIRTKRGFVYSAFSHILYKTDFPDILWYSEKIKNPNTKTILLRDK